MCFEFTTSHWLVLYSLCTSCTTLLSVIHHLYWTVCHRVFVSGSDCVLVFQNDSMHCILMLVVMFVLQDGNTHQIFLSVLQYNRMQDVLSCCWCCVWCMMTTYRMCWAAVDVVCDAWWQHTGCVGQLFMLCVMHDGDIQDVLSSCWWFVWCMMTTYRMCWAAVGVVMMIMIMMSVNL